MRVSQVSRHAWPDPAGRCPGRLSRAPPRFGRLGGMRLADIVIPDTPAARGSLEVATAYCSPALLNHSVRAYLWAAAYGAMNDIAFDAELLYVASMMHDIGLVK